MEIEEETKPKIFNSTNSPTIDKKLYFRIEKKKRKFLEQIHNDAKKIFKTQKDYNISKAKAVREFKKIKINKNKHNINKFVTTMDNDKENKSFIIQKDIPKELKIFKEQKNESKQINDFWKSKKNVFLTENNICSNEQKINFCYNKTFKENEKKINNYKIKLMLVYFCSIKNLCKYINTNFFNNSLTEQKAIDDLILQIYQSLHILDRKINQFMHFESFIRVNKEDFDDISSLKENLLLMKNTLNNKMSQELINIYIDIDNFCKLYS